MAFQKVGLTFYCDRGCRRQSSSYPLTTFLVRHERRGACKKRSDFYTFAFFFSLFFRSVCLFVWIPERVKLNEAEKKQKKQTNKIRKQRRRRQQLAGGGGGVTQGLDLPAHTWRSWQWKKKCHKRLPYLFCTIIFLVTLGVNVWRRRKIFVLI